jgi:hypothetical protein
MLNCESCRTALLDRHYGLLETTDVAGIEAHLAGCPACRAEQARVERFGRLLITAARSEFPDVRFVAPVAEPLNREAAPSVHGPAWSRLAAQPLKWAVAAAVLLAIGIPTGIHLTTVHRQRVELAAAIEERADAERRQADTVTRHSEAINNAAAELQKTQQDYSAAEGTLLAKLDESRREMLSKQLDFVVSGPAAIQAGAPAEYRIQTRDPAGNPAAAIVTYQVKDRADKVVLEKTSLMTEGDVTVKLPPTLPLTPNRDLVLEVAAERAGGPKAVLREQIKLAAPVYMTHLATDKPLYQPGEVVHFRSLTLERASLKPADEPLNLQYVVRDPLGVETAVVAGTTLLTAADGKPIAGPDGTPVHGIGAGEWTIPPTATGGEYTLAVKETNGRLAEEKRKFLVNRYQAARLNKELEWSRKSFGPGDEVVANCKVTNASGAVANQPVTAEAVVDGKHIPVPCGPTNSAGAVAVRFTLPKQIEKGEGSLSVAFTDGGNQDSLVKPIPIALKKLLVDFYAEGGDLVAGALNRVYFQARTTLGKPADLKGRVIDESGHVMATAETLTDANEPGINQGVGRFEFTPEAGHSYRLMIDRPTGTEGEFKLPNVKTDGVILTALSEVSGDPDPIRVRVTSRGADRALLVGAYARGRLLDHQRVSVPAGQFAEVDLKPQAGLGGVTRLTVFEEAEGNGGKKELTPRAERLVFRKPASTLHVTVKPDKGRYTPGEHVTLSFTAQDEKNQAAPAIAMVGVVNKSVVTMADEKTFRAMPTHFLLTSEVRRPEDLEHADVLLGSHPKAAAALDLLLGTQGWRRFAEQNIAPPNRKDDGDRIFLAQANSPRLEANSSTLAAQKVQDEYGPPVTSSRVAVAAAAARLNQLQSDAGFAEERRRLAAEIADTGSAVHSRQAELNVTLAARERILSRAAPVAAVLFSAVAVTCLVAGVWLGVRYYVTAAGALAVATAAAFVLAVDLGVNPSFEQAARSASELSTVTAVRRNPAEAMPVAADIGAADKPAEDARAFKAKVAEAELRLEYKRAAAPPPPMAAPAGAPARAALAANDPMKVALGVNQVDKFAVELAKDRELGLARKKEFVGVLRDEPAAVAEGLANRANKAPFGWAAGAEGRRRLMQDRGGGLAVGGGRLRPPMPEPFVVREYSHRHVTPPSGDRSDFAETVFWHPVLVLPKDGAKVSFDLNDEVTRYQVLVAAHTVDGRLGAVESQFEARKPLSIDPKLPVEISAGDRVDVPVTAANDTDSSRAVAIAAEATGLEFVGSSGEKLDLGPQKSARRVFSFRPTMAEGTANLRLSARCQPFADDSVVRTIAVVPNGFPIVGSISGNLEGNVRQKVTLPQTWVPDTLKCQVTVYPSTLAELQKGLEALLSEPGGCFEQASTTNYPNALVLQYLKESNQANPAAMKRAKELLDRGYAKLTAFEVPEKSKRQGFEWFGQFPPHEALTAYGLMQFRDMARVSDVDPQLLRRTQDFLLARRDGKGGFTRSPQALDTFGRAPDDVTNAYIIWALTESGKHDDVTKELDAVAAQAKASDDPYFLALVANCLLNRDRAGEARPILQKLANKLTKDGCLTGAKTSITGSAGRTLEIETTALGVLAWLKADKGGEFSSAVRVAVGWIGKQRGGYGGFGSTQSTILALKALNAYTKANKKTAEAGELSLVIGDRVLAKLAFTAGAEEALTVAVPDPERQLKPGTNEIRVDLTGKNSFPYTLAWSYRTLQPPSAERCAVRLTAGLDRPTLAEGDTARLNVKLENVSGKGQGMAVAIIGLPAGLRLPDDFAQLKDLARPRDDGTKPGRIGAFEVRGRELVLYWRDLAPDAAIDLSIDVRAQTPGEYHGPACRAYLYYNPDVKYWTIPLAATIRAAE